MYLGLMLFIAVMGAGLVQVGQVWKTSMQREQEDELLFIGAQFQKAIGDYYDRTPGTVKKFPKTLEDLVEDNRFINPQRHLRRVFMDPLTRDTNWGKVSAPDGGIMGIYSLSPEAPLRQKTRLPNTITVVNRVGYGAWTFNYVKKVVETKVPNVEPDSIEKSRQIRQPTPPTQPVM